MKTVGSTNWYDRIGEGYNNLRQPNWKLLLQAPADTYTAIGHLFTGST